jgi:hypothetical protein
MAKVNLGALSLNVVTKGERGPWWCSPIRSAAT